MNSDGVAAALRCLSDDTFGADDGTYVAVVILMRAGDSPDIAVCDRNGDSTRIKDLRFGKAKDVEVEALWSMEDLSEACRHLSLTVTELERAANTPDDWPIAGEVATSRVKQRHQDIRDYQLQQAIARDAYLIEHPHVCEHCGSRHRTARGLIQHQAVSKFCKHIRAR